MSDMGDAGSSSAPLNASGVDFGNETSASDFLEAMLDDTTFSVTGVQFAAYFWYGAAVLIGLAAISNLVQLLTFKLRYEQPLASSRRRVITHSFDQVTCCCSQPSSPGQASKYPLQINSHSNCDSPRMYIYAIHTLQKRSLDQDPTSWNPPPPSHLPRLRPRSRVHPK